MPTVLRFGAFRVMIYINDHRPAHVHVFARGREAVLILNCWSGPPEVRENYGFSRPEMRQIRQSVTAHLQLVCEAWKEIYGQA